MKRYLVLSALIAVLAFSAALACEMEAGMKAEGHECPMSMKGVDRTVTNIDNGVRIEITAADPAVVQTIQTRMAAETKSAGCCKDCVLSNAAWTKKVENTSKGVVLTLTAGSKDEVGKLQTTAAGTTKGECPHKAAQKATKA